MYMYLTPSSHVSYPKFTCILSLVHKLHVHVSCPISAFSNFQIPISICCFFLYHCALDFVLSSVDQYLVLHMHLRYLCINLEGIVYLVSYSAIREIVGWTGGIESGHSVYGISTGQSYILIPPATVG